MADVQEPTADQWPRAAVPLSIGLAVLGVLLALWGISTAGDASASQRVAALVLAPLTAVACTGIVVLYGRRPALRLPLFVVTAVLALALFLLTRTALEGVALAGLGGAVVGCMVGNIAAVRRARRSTRSVPARG